MEDENEYKKLPTEDKCVHNMWKARLAGYEEAIKLFNQIDDEKSQEWMKYLGLIKKFVSDNNAVAQERGLEAALVFVENCGHAGKTTGEVMSGIVSKCIAAPKTKTKDLALQVTLMYVEIEKHETVQEELMKGMDQKNPKVVTACIAALNNALKQFGNKVIAIKPMVKKIPVLLADRDKGVRGEMKALVVEMHRWIGPAIEPHIASLQPVVQQELREAFGSNETAIPTRYLRSQQQKMAERVVRTQDDVDGECEDDENEAGAGDSGDLDPYDMMDPIEILSKIPKDFYEKIEQTKWQIRKEGLDYIENLLKNSPRLEPGEYGDLVRALKKIIGKDSNVMLVALAGRLLALLASGLRTKFSPYAASCCQTILEKFKEKKVNVVTSLREAIDAIYPSTNLEAIMEDLLAAFNNKNPSVKTESALFMSRALCRTQPAAFGKKLVKAYVPALLKLLDCAEPAVRDAAAEALGTATKLVGEKAIAPHIDKLDPLKEQKIKEYTEKAVIQVKVAAPKKEKGKPAAKGDAAKSAGSSDPKPVKRSTTATKKPAAKKAAAPKASPSPPREPELSQEEVDEKAEMIFSEDILSGLSQSNWQQRLTAVQGFISTVQGLTPEDVSGQVLMRTLARKPGFKDTNIQGLKARLDAAKYVLDNFPVTITTMEPIIPDLVTKLGEPSCSGVSAGVLSAAAASCGASCVSAAAVSEDLRGPKAQAELLTWLGTIMQQYTTGINVKPIIAHCKKCLQATNPSIRQGAITLLGIMSQFTGPSLLTHFESEKPATKQLISLEMDKYGGTNPSTPTRNITKSSSRASVADDIDDNYEDGAEDEVAPVEDNKPRTDIAPLITDSLIEEISDKNWKVRFEALEKLKTIISTSAPIKSSLGELPPALVARLVDSNSKLAQTALQICESLAVAMGAKCRQHVRTFFPGFLQAFGDNKAWIRQSSLSCVGAWCTAAGGAGVSLEGEIALDALKTGSPLLRTTLWTWLSENLPLAPPKSVSRDDLSSIVAILYVCIEDRSPDVRRSATACVLPVMTHLGYEPMARQMERLKPGSKTVIQGALDKARALLPVQPLPSKPKKEDSKGVKSGGALKKDTEKKTVVTGKAKGIVKPSSAASRNKKDEDELTPLLPNNNAKHQRIIDDQKLKVLKWNFTTPREEFFDLLKEQMATAGLNKQLVANMFHADFRYHIKAIESLSEDLHDNGSSLVANLDLILKWLTLRFFDTNPSVILKGLEYLAQVFTYLIEIDYTMAEYEANCFIPYLVLKVGDPKDTVRNGVKALFKQICVVYSVTKLFGYLMEGLKSKNARQRAECLECIGHLLETYGSVVMSGNSALRELARHIGDRDNAVRSNALNCIAIAYFLEGEKVYRMIGQISDKDLSLLEERIKRATKTRSAESRRSMIVPLSAAGKPIVQEQEPRRIISVDTHPGEEYEDEPEEEEEEEKPPLPPPEVVKSSPPRIVSGPYGLDPDLVARLDAEIPRVPKTNLPELDLRFLDEPVPTVHMSRGSTLPTMSPRSIPPPSAPVSSVSQISQQVIDDARLADTIHSIGSPDIHTAIRALSLVSGAVSTGRAAALSHNYDRLLAALAAQLASLRSGGHAPHDALHAYKCISAVLTNLYESGAAASSPNAGAALSSLLCELLKVLGGGIHDERVVRLLNNVCVRLLEHADRCHLLCSIVSLLHESIGVTDECSPRYQDLLLKCFWKTLKMMSSWDISNVKLEPAMLAVHRFYKAYPNAYWKKNQDVSDTPYKTVKTLVHTLVKMKGTSIMVHLPQDPNIQESELYLYLLKVFKQLKLDDKNLPENTNGNVLHAVNTSMHVNTTAHVNTSLHADRAQRAVHDELAKILKKFGNKQQVPEAFEELRDFTEAHPSVDIWTYMQGSSFYFRNFVERGLRDIRAPAPYTTRVSDSIDVSNENDDKSHIVFLERLRALQAKAGMKLESPGSTPRTPIDNRVLCDDDPLRKSILDPQLQLNTTSITSQRNEAGVDALRLKLQQIKSSSKR